MSDDITLKKRPRFYHLRRGTVAILYFPSTSFARMTNRSFLLKVNGTPLLLGKWDTMSSPLHPVPAAGDQNLTLYLRGKMSLSSTTRTKLELKERRWLWKNLKQSQSQLKLLHLSRSQDKKILVTLWSEADGQKLISIRISNDRNRWLFRTYKDKS